SPLAFRSHQLTLSVPSLLSLHDALPISAGEQCLDVGLIVLVTGEGDLPLKVRQGADMGKAIARPVFRCGILQQDGLQLLPLDLPDRKSTRLNSSHVSTSYAVFCLKKKNI